MVSKGLGKDTAISGSTIESASEISMSGTNGKFASSEDVIVSEVEPHNKKEMEPLDLIKLSGIIQLTNYAFSFFLHHFYNKQEVVRRNEN